MKGLFFLAQILDFRNDYTGIDNEKAENNIELYGYNSDTKLDEKTKGYEPATAFFNLRFIIMIICSVLSFIYGINSDDGYRYIYSGIVLLILSGVYSAAEIIKNTSCDEYFFELKRRAKTTFRVMRDSEIRHIRRELIVPDDILILEEGESVPADAHLLEIHDLTVDESIFTGSKAPVSKITGSDNLNEEIKKSCIYKGTKIISGSLVARVSATGVDTKYFKTFGAPEETDEYYTAFEKIVVRISNIFSVIAAVMLVFGAFFHFSAINIKLENPVLDSLYNTFYPAAAFALCFIPASTASLIRIYYINGAKKIEEKNSSVKSLKTLEYINAVTCILIDKSGMITKNHMEIADIYTANKNMMTNISVLACGNGGNDLFDKAIILHAAFDGVDVSEIRQNKCLKEYPFDEALGAVGNLWLIGGRRLLCVKGAPEKMLPLCDVPNDMLYTVQNKQISYGQQGYNVLVTAFAQLPDDAPIPETISEAHFSFMGMTAFTNQTKDYIPAAIRNCHRAGIRVIMTSGDSPETSLAIAKKIGIKGDTTVTGEMLENDEDFDVYDTGVYARITAEQKPLIIKKLKEAGEIVAITGESASDSDMLELADVGISLDKNVSGAAFEACDVISGSESFETVTDIIRISRQTHINIKRCIGISFAALIAMIIFSVFNIITGGTPLFSPAAVSLITVAAVPAAAMMFIKNNRDIKDTMESSSYIGSGVLNKTFFLKPVIQAVGIAVSEIVFCLISSGNITDGEDLSGIRGGLFLLFVTGLLFSCHVEFIGKNIKEHFSKNNSFMWMITFIILAAAAVIVFVPFVDSVFGFSSPDLIKLLISLIISAAVQLLSLFTDTDKKKMYVSGTDHQ